MTNKQIQYLELAAKRDRYRTNNIFHFIMSIITLGLWVPIWALVALSNGIERMKCERKINKL